ncbi:MAG: DUF2189 domain-containing protein [Rhizobiales bacterium]|nr:DUF2189 domain-containing protein [Hyphomicrobiales bacterium]
MSKTIEASEQATPTPQENADQAPRLRKIALADLQDALARGVDDFQAMRTYVIFLGIVYALVGLVLIRLTFSYRLVQLVFPLISGFALIGPFVSLGLMELSRRRAAGLDTNWARMIGVVRTASSSVILALGFLLLVTFIVWIAVAMSIYEATFGTEPLDLPQFLTELFTTGHGWMLIILGNGVGALFALFVLAISVVSFPLAVDRKVDFPTAILTSIRAVAMNPIPMLAWGLIVGAAFLIGAIPLFIGLAIALPILGHATWHLYTKVVERPSGRSA